MEPFLFHPLKKVDSTFMLPSSSRYRSHVSQKWKSWEITFFIKKYKMKNSTYKENNNEMKKIMTFAKFFITPNSS